MEGPAGALPRPAPPHRKGKGPGTLPGAYPAQARLGDGASAARRRDPGPRKVPQAPHSPPPRHPKGTPPTCPGLRCSRDNSPANPRRAVGVAFTFASRAGPSIFRLPGLTWVGLRRGRGGARTGRKPVLARPETRKTPAEPAAGAAAAEAAGAAASRPPASQSRLASGGEGTQPPPPPGCLGARWLPGRNGDSGCGLPGRAGKHPQS